MQHSANGQTATLTLHQNDVVVWQQYQVTAFLLQQAIRALDENEENTDTDIQNARRLVLIEMRIQARDEALAALAAVEWS